MCHQCESGSIMRGRVPHVRWRQNSIVARFEAHPTVSPEQDGMLYRLIRIYLCP